MKDFAAIDFETANGKRTSVCSVGVVVVRGGEMTDSFYSLIRPRPNFYSRFTTAIHGLTYDDTAEAPDFAAVWQRDRARASRACRSWRTTRPSTKGACKRGLRPLRHALSRLSVLLYLPGFAADIFGAPLPNHQLHTVSAACGFDLANHHHALADAEACARIALKIL